MESHLTSLWLSPKNALFNRKVIFRSWPTLVSSHLFSKLAGSNYKNYESHAGQVMQNVNCSELSVELTLLGLSYTMKGWILSMATSSRKSKFYLCVVFSIRALLRAGHHVIREFTLSINKKDQHRDLYDYLSQGEITAINNLDGSLGDNLIRANERKF